MSRIDTTICHIDFCGKPLAPLKGDRKLQEEDDFRCCVEHEKKLLAALRKLRG